MTTAKKLAVAAVGLLITMGAVAMIVGAQRSGSDTRVDTTASDTTPSDTTPSDVMPSDLMACVDLPHHWREAQETYYRWTTRTVTFTWEDGQTATLRDTDPGCDSQPGIEGALRSHREGHLVALKADCQELRHLVEAVIEERQAQGKPTSDVGRVPVSDAAAEKAYGKNPKNARYIESGEIHEMRAPTIDLDRSVRTLEDCPE
ncbi:MAG: hypothetical protein ACRDZ3_02875 [Acidimicrobiia bacterium]